MGGQRPSSMPQLLRTPRPRSLRQGISSTLGIGSVLGADRDPPPGKPVSKTPVGAIEAPDLAAVEL